MPLNVGLGLPEDVLDVVVVVVTVPEVYTDLSLYSERPFGPPHISVELPAHTILHRPSVAVVEPAARVFPQ
jgi:hypothetical protein